MILSLHFGSSSWYQVGGYYHSDGAHFFANSESASSGPVAPTTGLDLVICNGMSLSTSVLKLFLLSVWNAKIPETSLRQTVGNHILQR